MTKDEALNLAIEALEAVKAWDVSNLVLDIPLEIKQKIQTTINTAKEALVQPEPAPVAFKYTDAQGKTILVETSVKPYDDATLLYEGPVMREWVGLTDDERLEIYKNQKFIVGFFSVSKFAYNIEAKLKEKNT